jgi:hypothetical protein
LWPHFSTSTIEAREMDYIVHKMGISRERVFSIREQDSGQMVSVVRIAFKILKDPFREISSFKFLYLVIGDQHPSLLASYYIDYDSDISIRTGGSTGCVILVEDLF